MSDFDITKHEWSDSGIEDCSIAGNEVQIEDPEYYIHFEKSDAIALARHFKLTEADLCQ